MNELVEAAEDLFVEPGWVAHLLEQEAVLGVVAPDEFLGSRRPRHRPRRLARDGLEQPSPFELPHRIERGEVRIRTMTGVDRAELLPQLRVAQPVSVGDREPSRWREQVAETTERCLPVEPMNAVAGDDQGVRRLERRILDRSMDPADLLVGNRLAPGDHRCRAVDRVDAVDKRCETARQVTGTAARVQHHPGGADGERCE